MPSPKTIAAVRIARSLKPAEIAVNQAALQVLAMGTAVLTARADGTFHPLECQTGVDHVGEATMKVFAALKDIKAAHGEFRKTAERHQILGQGDIFETPDHDTPRGELIKLETAQRVA
ncbi:hypothetical protein SAMN06297144_1199 [Sphingomonas guangdongensis]|uniref:Uncharacterized protein n=1 Tax=Sphingomonas guangdongensis TaxID=1141890 RepID=A0A285QGS4_9SPHN|nr:hypothetical protein [Sphingomonas guangdongensis]SOB80708.1 hypothetical protein SAMN06297144_1199 [Sphingomonas guangdongensis]